MSTAVPRGPSSLIILAAQLALGGCTSALPRAAADDAASVTAVELSPPDSALVAALAEFTESRIATDSLSGVVLLARDGVPIYKRTVTLANTVTRAPNRLDTRFNLASVDKYFTRIAIRQLQQVGRLTASDLVGKHLPDYPNARVRDEVTIQHLLNMSSGLGDFTGEDYGAWAAQRSSLRGIDDYLALFANDTLRFAPGTQQYYSNAGYVALGKIIERASGQSYYDYVQRHIFDPAGMVNTGYSTSDESPPNTAIPYTTAAAAAGNFSAGAQALTERRAATSLLPYRGSSAGGGYSTAEDLLRLTRALTSYRLLNEAYTDSLLRFRRTGAGEFDFDGWTGGSEGANTVVYLHSTGHTLIVLSNYDPPSATVYRRKLWGEWLPEWLKSVAP